MEYFTENIIDAKSLTFNEWKNYMFTNQFRDIFPNICFPTDEIEIEFIKNIKSFNENEIKHILRRFIVHTGYFGADEYYLKLMIANNSKAEIKELINSSEYYRRIFTKEPAWEGITWILDLLPSYPNEAIKALDAYFITHCILAPDFVINGLSDASTIINARYIEYENPQQVFLNLSPIDFELLVAKLYKELGFEITMTKKSHDGGIDIIAFNNSTTKKEKIIIQCKRYEKNITVKELRELNGTVNDYPLHFGEKITKGVLVCSSDFTNSAKKEYKNNHTIELIGYKELNKLLNKYLGTNWILKLNNILNDEKIKST